MGKKSALHNIEKIYNARDGVINNYKVTKEKGMKVLTP